LDKKLLSEKLVDRVHCFDPAERQELVSAWTREQFLESIDKLEGYKKQKISLYLTAKDRKYLDMLSREVGKIIADSLENVHDLCNGANIAKIKR